tara:strand:+ start:228 stop:1076 length:849 start_codon:yes stop_codon:yes gene_type:complete
MKHLINFLILFISYLVPQENIKELIDNVLSGDIEDAKINLPILSENYPNNPNVMFLTALLETNGDSAMKVFKEIYNLHPTSDYGDDAVMKVSEYYYAAGLYIQASQWLQKMPRYYARSENIERALKLYLNSLIVSGHKDTAVFYAQVFQRQFPKLGIDGKINELIMEFDKSEKQSEKDVFKDNAIEDKSGIQVVIEKIKKPEKIIDNKFSIQTGAFSIKENAEKQKEILRLYGYTSSVKQIDKGDRVLWGVRVGYYENRSEAEKIASKIKLDLDLPTMIILN